MQKRKRVIILGDFNINVLNADQTAMKYKEELQTCGYRLLNKVDESYCTRETATTKTIIDHVSTNLADVKFHLAIIATAMSDHNQIYLEVKKHEPTPPRRIKYEAIDYEKLYKTVREWNTTNEDDLYQLLEQKLLSSINSSKITKYKILNPPRQDWINRTIINLINKRNILWNMHKKTVNDQLLQEKFINQRNEANQFIQQTKSAYYQNAFDQCKKNPKKMWSLINDLSRNKVREPPAPSKLLMPSGALTDQTDICECFNDFFSNIGSVLASQIPSQYHNNLTHTKGTQATGTLDTLSQLRPCTINEVEKIIENLKLNTSSGIDGINTKSIKCVKDLILDEITNCINKNLELGTFPDSLKIAKVSPIHKNGSKSDPGNYRPISVLPVLSKIFERVLYNRLDEHLGAQNFLYKQQYGFRPKSNTLSATVDLITKIKISIDKKQVALGIFVDLKKAFDTISHKLLLKKLNDIGVTGSALDMFKSYLSNRFQVVKINETQSSPRAVSFGIPQGSILGPLLFLIYINNIHEIGLKGDVSLYADDTALFYFGHSVDAVMSDAQDDLNLLNKWFQYNLLTINIAKTNYIIFAAKNKKISHQSKLTINNKIIKKVGHEKYLGLILDSHLNWKPHIERVRSKLTSLTGALRSVVRCFPRQVRYNIYNTLIKPHLDYLVEVWGTAAKTNIETLQIAQNKLIKTLFQYDYSTQTQKIYSETKLMNISQTYIFNTCILIRKILNRDIHTQIHFTRKHQKHKIGLRNANDIQLYSPRTNYGKKNLMYEGAALYNKLPNNIKNAKSMSIFKKLLKLHILNQNKASAP